MTSSISAKLSSLTVFRALLEDAVISALDNFFYIVEDGTAEEKIGAYCDFVSLLFASETPVLSEYISAAVNNDENAYILRKGAGQSIPVAMEKSVERELGILQEIASLNPSDFIDLIGADIELPAFDNAPCDIPAVYRERVADIGRYGYGIYSRYYMFSLSDDGVIEPVKKPDPITLDELVDYEREKKIIIDNTNALLRGRPAANMLLSGDAGTGKSSTVKAVVNALRTEGLRILEVRKEQLFLLPKVLSRLNENPLKFIIFIDDLSFQKDDDNFSALKAILEGSVSAKSSNVVIYATSNRRHLVKESFSDREGDDIHRNDTMQEIISLSDRFGIQLTFFRPDKKTYLHIVKKLADYYGITMPEAELEAEAERFTLSRGNRSARAAKQFIDSLRSKEE